MRRRLLLSVALLLVGLAFLGAIVLTLVYRDGVDRSGRQVTPEMETFQKLHKGMTAAEVEAIIGRPADDGYYFTFRHCQVWKGDGWQVTVCFGGRRGGADEGDFAGANGTKLRLREDPELR